MTPQKVAGRIDDVTIIDVRTDEEVALASINTEFLHIPLDRLAEEWNTIPTEKAVVVMCHHGMRSQRAAHFLQSQGVAAISMVGGIDLWSLSVDGSVPRY